METKDRRKRPRTASNPAPQRKRTAPKERKLRDADVIYTPPKTFKRKKFLLHLASVAAVVLAVVMGMSIFFKVENVTVSGCNKYTPWEVAEASGIETGSNLMTLSRAQISGNIISKLPYTDTVRVGIILPDTVNIEITEMDAVFSVEDAQGGWWLMNDQGKIVEQTNGVTAKDYTQVLGVRLESPVIGQQAVAYEAGTATIPVTGADTQPDETTQEGDESAQVGEETTEPTTLPENTPTISVGVTGAERLQTALIVLQQVGNSSICDQIDSVDVSKLQTLELWYDERFQINLGDATRMDYKIGALKATIDKMESYESGHLDLSFTNWPDKVGYTPFT